MASLARRSRSVDAYADFIGEGSRKAMADEEIRAAVKRVADSKAFAGAKRAQTLLSYLVEEVLAGRSASIKEHTIAQDVFGRDETFDPKIDTCVRTEAWRLRQRLSTYYSAEGGLDTVRINFAPRSLVPIFSGSGSEESYQAPRRRGVLISFVPRGDAGEIERSFLARLEREVVLGLQPSPAIAAHLERENTALSDFSLSCSLQTDANSTRVIATLVDQSSGEVRASEAFSRKLPLASVSPRLVAGAIVPMVTESLSPASSAPSIDLLDEADCASYLDSLLRGSFTDRSRRLAELRSAIRRQERIIQQDPEDRQAHRRIVSALGLVLSMAPTATLAIIPKLSKFAHDVLALDPSLNDVWLTLGLAAGFAYDWPTAENAFRQAIAINPVDPSPYVLLAICSLSNGNVAQAMEAAEIARSLDPLSPLAASCYGQTLGAVRRFSDAATVARRGLEIDPGFPRLHLLLGESSMYAGDLETAVSEFEICCESMPADSTAYGLLGLAQALSGKHKEAQALLATIEQSPDMRVQASSAAAMIHIGLGARDQALSALQQAVRRRGTPDLFFVSAAFDPIRSDRRFSDIGRAMGFSA